MFLLRKIKWNLLAKCLAGEANEKEKEAITNWIEKKPANRKLFGEIKSHWMKMDKGMNSRFDVDNAWDKIYDRITNNSDAVMIDHSATLSVTSLRTWITPFRIAASILVLAVIGTVLYFTLRNYGHVDVSSAQYDRTSVVTLPDGSQVYLNDNTSLSYNRQFGKRSRVVKLNGEAFFEVIPDKTKPFRIIAGGACVKVLGTSFNVNTRKHVDQVEVYVSTGIVELSEMNDERNRVLLHPGNIGVLSSKTITSAKAENQNCIAWRTGNLTFRDTRLSEVTSLLNDVYRVNIIPK
jgi:transmembrane sensor